VEKPNVVTRIGLAGAKPVKTYFKEWREWKGWTQQEMADRIGTSKQTVSRVESGDRDWGKGYLEAFAHVVGCSNPTDPITRPPDAPITLDDMVRGMPAEKREQVIHFVEFMRRSGTDG
jgi:transcriptional regulator with XRE-family HTH domain